MVSGDTIAVVDKESATLELWRIVEETDGGVPSLCTIVRLGLPPLMPGASVINSSCIRESVPAYSDAPSLVTEGRPSRRFPFHNSTEDGLIVIVMDIENHWHVLASYPNANVTIVTHLRTLVTLATSTSPGVTFIPWENWGPRVTACFDDLIHQFALMGERLTIITNEGLSLLDFNLSRIRDAIGRSGNSSGHSVHVTTVKHRSVIPRGNLFREDVVGELPYISVVRPVPLSFNLANYEEGLAGLSWGVRGRLSPFLCSFQALIIGNVTEDGVFCPGLHNRMNVYDMEPGLRVPSSVQADGMAILSQACPIWRCRCFHNWHEVISEGT